MQPLDLQDTTWSALKDEAVRHLQILLRLNTTNPPGNEAPAINYLREQLDAAGDERISVENMGFGMRVLYNAIARIC